MWSISTCLGLMMVNVIFPTVDVMSDLALAARLWLGPQLGLVMDSFVPNTTDPDTILETLLSNNVTLSPMSLYCKTVVTAKFDNVCKPIKVNTKHMNFSKIVQTYFRILTSPAMNV